jgi:hypothetical protein
MTNGPAPMGAFFAHAPERPDLAEGQGTRGKCFPRSLARPRPRGDAPDQRIQAIGPPAAQGPRAIPPWAETQGSFLEGNL